MFIFNINKTQRQCSSTQTIGHLPREISRFTRFLISRGANVFVTVRDSHHRRSPLVQGGLEIPVKLTVRREAASEKNQALERFKELVQRHYKVPTKTANLMTEPKKCCLISSRRRAVTKRSMSHNPLTGYWAIVFDIVNVVVANPDFPSVFVA